MSVAVDTSRQRVVFGDQIEPGMIVLEKCHGKACDSGTTHTPSPVSQPAEHELTILKLRKDKYSLAAITVDEDGNQQPWSGRPDSPTRVRA